MSRPTLNLGDLIDALDAVEDNRASVVFDFEHTHPTTVASWRGDYSHAALGWLAHGYGPMAGERGEPERENTPPAVETLLNRLRDALIDEHEGWKGGTYHFQRHTPLHVANPGNVGNTVIVKVKVAQSGDVILITRYREEQY